MEGPEDPRVRFAAERTLLAWIRTGLALMGFGFVLARFSLFLHELATTGHEGTSRSYHQGGSLWIGIALVLLGVGVTMLGAMEHRRVLARLNRREPFVPARWSLGLALAVLLAMLGVATAVYLVLIAV